MTLLIKLERFSNLSKVKNIQELSLMSFLKHFVSLLLLPSLLSFIIIIRPFLIHFDISGLQINIYLE
jgi:hypothetical protein